MCWATRQCPILIDFMRCVNHVCEFEYEFLDGKTLKCRVSQKYILFHWWCWMNIVDIRKKNRLLSVRYRCYCNCWTQINKIKANDRAHVAVIYKLRIPQFLWDVYSNSVYILAPCVVTTRVSTGIDLSSSYAFAFYFSLFLSPFFFLYSSDVNRVIKIVSFFVSII